MRDEIDFVGAKVYTDNASVFFEFPYLFVALTFAVAGAAAVCCATHVLQHYLWRGDGGGWPLR